jgi:hypothetical protein
MKIIDKDLLKDGDRSRLFKIYNSNENLYNDDLTDDVVFKAESIRLKNRNKGKILFLILYVISILFFSILKCFSGKICLQFY